MQVNVTLQLAAGDPLPDNPGALAATILAECGGDAAEDVCYLSWTPPPSIAGTPPETGAPAGTR